MVPLRPIARFGTVVAAGLLVIAGAAVADVGGKLTGGQIGKPPLRGKAYLDRIENPYIPGKPADPRPHLVVVLEATGDTVVDKTPPPQLRWRLLGESFERPLLPVLAGTEIVIKNDGTKRAPTLYVEGDETTLMPTARHPGTERAFKADKPGLLVLRDKDTPYLNGSVLVLETPYFAAPARDGTFKIAGIKDGTYTAKVWYRTGWVSTGEEVKPGESPRPLEKEIVVTGGKASLDLELPTGLPLANP
jgi:hypothetical protein